MTAAKASDRLMAIARDLFSCSTSQSRPAPTRKTSTAARNPASKVTLGLERLKPRCGSGAAARSGIADDGFERGVLMVRRISFYIAARPSAPVQVAAQRAARIACAALERLVGRFNFGQHLRQCPLDAPD